MNDQPPSTNPAGDDPTAVQHPVPDPRTPQPGASEWPAEPGPAWNPPGPAPQPGASYGGYPGQPDGTQPSTPYGTQPSDPHGAPFGTQSGASYGTQPASYGAEPGASYGAQSGASYGAQPGVSYGAEPGASYGAQSGAPYGAEPGAPYGAQPGSAYGAPQPGAYQGFPGSGAPGHPAPGSGGTSGFAIASLIFGILGGILLSVIFGIVALVQIRKRGQTGRGMAITGLVLSGCWVLLIIAGVTAAIISDSRDGGSTGSTTGGGTVAVTTLKPGDCINGIQSNGAIEDLPVVACGLPHEGEVYAIFNLPAGPWPGDTAVQEQAETRCKAEFKTYAPNAPDTVNVLYLHPLQQSWTRDRGVTCVATDERGTSTGSVRD